MTLRGPFRPQPLSDSKISCSRIPNHLPCSQRNTTVVCHPPPNPQRAIGPWTLDSVSWHSSGVIAGVLLGYTTVLKYSLTMQQYRHDLKPPWLPEIHRVICSISLADISQAYGKATLFCTRSKTGWCRTFIALLDICLQATKSSLFQLFNQITP